VYYDNYGSENPFPKNYCIFNGDFVAVPPIGIEQTLNGHEKLYRLMIAETP